MRQLLSWPFRAIAHVWRALNPDIRDAHAYAGMLLLAGGLGMYGGWPVALSVMGAVLLVIALR